MSINIETNPNAQIPAGKARNAPGEDLLLFMSGFGMGRKIAYALQTEIYQQNTVFFQLWAKKPYLSPITV